MTATAAMTEKDQEAAAWVAHDFSFSDTVEVYRFIAPNENAPDEPIKLLTVSNDRDDNDYVDNYDELLVYTFPAANGNAFALHTVLISMNEMRKIREGLLPLPPGWDFSSAQHFTCPEPACVKG